MDRTWNVWATEFTCQGKLTDGGMPQMAIAICSLRFGTAPPEAFTVAFTPDTKILAGGGGETITLWDVSTGALLRTLKRRQR